MEPRIKDRKVNVQRGLFLHTAEAAKIAEKVPIRGSEEAGALRVLVRWGDPLNRYRKVRFVRRFESRAIYCGCNRGLGFNLS